MENLINNIKWAINNNMGNHILKMYINEYIDECVYDDHDTYQDGYDEGYADCLQEEKKMDWDDVLETYEDRINDMVYNLSEDILHEKEDYIKEKAREDGESYGYEIGYEEGESKGYESGYESGYEIGYKIGYKDGESSLHRGYDI